MSVIPDELDATVMRNLGEALIGRARAMEEAGRRGRLRLSEVGIQMLTEILSRGSRPTVGFYLRYRAADDDG
jgi:hypothetical protein